MIKVLIRSEIHTRGARGKGGMEAWGSELRRDDTRIGRPRSSVSVGNIQCRTSQLTRIRQNKARGLKARRDAE
eukprot:9437615-Pyramimonas_sp.AAC.2